MSGVSGTRAVPKAVMDAANSGAPGGLPMCPRCRDGYLQPFHVLINLRAAGHPPGGAGFDGASHLDGWVAVCHGNAAYLDQIRVLLAAVDAETPEGGRGWEPQVELSPACGFWMPMTPG